MRFFLFIVYMLVTFTAGLSAFDSGSVLIGYLNLFYIPIVIFVGIRLARADHYLEWEEQYPQKKKRKVKKRTRK